MHAQARETDYGDNLAAITDSVVAVFADHQMAEAAIRKLVGDGFMMKRLSVIGKGYHTEEKVMGFYNAGDRITFWGTRGTFWGGLWGLFFGGLFMTTPAMGSIMVLGYVASLVISVVESAVVFGGISALGAALCSIGIPKDSVIQYEADVKADRFVVMAHGSTAEIDRARAILDTHHASRLDFHSDIKMI